MVEIVIGLDYSHNNPLTLEAPSYAEFTQFLFSSGYKLGKIEAGFDSLEKLQMYNMIIISSPKNSYLSVDEIEILEEYVRMGGSLLIISSKGGDNSNKTNLSELAQRFGFEFAEDEIFDSTDYVSLQERPLLSKFKPHIITENLKKIVLSSACSVKILDVVEENKNIKIEKVVNGGINCWHKRYDGEKWTEEECPNIPLIIAVEYYKGKIVSFGSLSLFSSLGTEYGFTALENNILIANVFRWLSIDIYTQGKIIIVNLNLELFNWAENIAREKNWEDISDLINVSLKYFKDNYKKIIEDLQRIIEKKVEVKYDYKYAKKEPIKEKSEDKILDLIPARDTKDLFEILKTIEELTGEKYEPSLNLQKSAKKEGEVVKVIEDEEGAKVINEEKNTEQTSLESETQSSVNDLIYTNDDINQFEKESSKKAIWHNKPTKAFEEWIKLKVRN